MKIERLIGILSVLLQRDKVTSAELAEKFEVTRRTILRDIDTLNMSGIPIVTEQGQGGGISIMEGYRVDRTLLSSDDMQAILSGLRSLDSVSGTNRYRQLMEKISAGRPAAVNADERIIIDLASWDRSAVSDKIELIKQAMEHNCIISFRYYSPSGVSDRLVEPYHLVFQWSSWYVWGYCSRRGDYRLFKLTRMTRLTDTGQPCSERDVPEYVCDKLRHTRGEISATVRFDESVRWRIIDEFGAEYPGCGESGSIEMTFTWADELSLYSYVLTFGDKAEILSPPEYRLGFQEHLKKISGRYEI